MRLCSSALALGLLAFTSLAHADSVFTFSGVAAGTTLPTSRTVKGLTATFTGEASVCSSYGFFSSLKGNILVQGLCNTGESGALGIDFSKNLSDLSFDFATNGGTGAVTVDLFEGSKLVGVDTFDSVIPDGFYNGEGFASLSGTFDAISISSDSLLGIDNVDARAVTPEPSSLLLLGTGLLGFTGVLRRKHLA